MIIYRRDWVASMALVEKLYPDYKEKAGAT